MFSITKMRSEAISRSLFCLTVVFWLRSPESFRTIFTKHPKNCECCPGHYLVVNHSPSMSWFKFCNLSVLVNCVTVTKSLNRSQSKLLSLYVIIMSVVIVALNLNLNQNRCLCSHCSYCSQCSQCSHCSLCSHCSHCSYYSSQSKSKSLFL